jgi:hypothetical protein
MAKEYPKVNMKDYDSSEKSKVTYLENMFTSAKNSKKHKIARWRRNEELVEGKFLKPFNLPKYKTRIEPNVIHSVIETMYSILTDRGPKVDIMPKREDQIMQAYNAQEAVEWVLQEKKAQKAVAAMKRDGLIYGNGFLKIAMVKGQIEYIVPDPFTVYIDGLATSISDAQCVIFATPTYVDDIEEIYGKRVQAEGKLDDNRSFVKVPSKYADDTFKWDDVDTKGPQESTESDDYRGGQALLKEGWYFDKGKLKLATWCGSQLLQDEDAPYDFIPLVSFQNYANAHTVWGKGEPEAIESIVTGAAIIMSQAVDNLIYHGNPAIVMSKSLAKMQGNQPTDKPGQIFYTNNPSERIDRLPAGNISSSSLPMAQSLLGLADTVSGVHDITQGRNPQGLTAARAIQQLQEASQQVIRAKEREIGTDAIIDMYKMTLKLLVNNYEEEISIRAQNEDGSFEFKKVQPYELSDDMDFKYIPGSSLPESRAARMDQAVDLLQLGLLDPESFWRWTQADISKDILQKINDGRKEREQKMEAEMNVMSNSTSEDEILEALLRQRELSGGAEKTRQVQMEGQRAKNQ